MRRSISLITLAACLLLFTAHRSPAPAVTTTELRCEWLHNPLGIDSRTPALSWELNSPQRGVQQEAYQVLVASSKGLLARNEGDLWNSGKVASDASTLVAYGGKPLTSRAACFWKVKVWTNKGEATWSSPARWTMGLLDSSDWKGQWIGMDKAFSWDSVSQFARLSARYLRREFKAPKQVQQATAYIAGLGLYELYLNGNKVGDQVLAPAPTDYSKSVLYNTHDVTALLQQGANAVGVVLGNGRFFAMRQNFKPQKWHTFGFPKLLFQLHIRYTDGSEQVVTSDAQWKLTADGPIRTNNEYDGEEYDATKELTNWSKPGFNDAGWLPVQQVAAPGGKLAAQMNEPMKVEETLRPRWIKQLKPGVHILDMGQNMAGWVRLRVKGAKGQTVKLRFAELPQPDGSLYVANLRDARVTDKYTLKGTGVESWEPSFVYHGFRYVEITNYPGTPTINDFDGRVVNDHLATTGSFTSADATLNQVFRNAWWGIRSNYKGMPVDCPQRNERQPWLGDRSTGAYGESFLFDNGKLYAKWLLDIEQSQTATGAIPDVAPSFWYYYKDNMTWPGTYLMVADMLWQQYGDKRPILHHYPAMKKWLAYMQQKYMKDYLFTKDNYGDWCVPPESKELIHAKDSSRITDPGVIATAYFCFHLQRMQVFAQLLGKKEDQQAFAALEQKVAAAFNKKYFNEATAQYSNNTATANLLPLNFGLVPKGKEAAVFAHVVAKTEASNGGHITTGVIGTQWLMRTLSRYGRPDLAYKLASNRDYPSWGYMAANGATTIWELWNGNTANPQMNSGNHVMLLGDLMVWYYEHLAGIRSAKDGFKELVMRPEWINGLNEVKASYRTPQGLVKSHWRRSALAFSWDITVPANSKAIIHVPASAQQDVVEAGDFKSATFLRMDGGRAVYAIGSGTYSFKSKWSGTSVQR